MDPHHFLFRAKDYFEALTKYAQSAQKVCIASFNIHAGMTVDGQDWSHEYPNMVHQFLDKLKDKRVEILLGIPVYAPCTSNCLSCKAKFEDLMKRTVVTAKHWPKYKWRFTTEFHMKAVIFLQQLRERKLTFRATCGMAGGRNLADSNWLDLSFHLTKEQADNVYELFTRYFNTAANINERNIKRATKAAIALK